MSGFALNLQPDPFYLIYLANSRRLEAARSFWAIQLDQKVNPFKNPAAQRSLLVFQKAVGFYTWISKRHFLLPDAFFSEKTP